MSVPFSEDEFHVADRIRECWRLWNLGLPFSRPIGYRNGKVWYAEHFSDERMEIDPVHLMSFFVDLFRLKKMDVFGRYEVKITEDNGAPCLRLVPIKKWVDNVTSFDSHLLELAKQALILTVIEDEETLNDMDFQWLCKHIENLEIRIRKPNGDGFFEGPCSIEFIVENEEKVTAILSINNEKYRISAGIHGNIFFTKIDSDSIPILSFPATCSLKRNSPEWSRIITNWGPRLFPADSGQGEIQKNILLTLEAELDYEQKYCVQYEAEDEFKPPSGWIRIHPNPQTKINAYTFWDLGIDAGDMIVAINQSNDVKAWSDTDKWLMINIDESDPFRLRIRSLQDRKIIVPSKVLPPVCQ